MSISALASAWTSPPGTDPFLTASTSQAAATFQASLEQWEQYGGTSGQAEPNQAQGFTQDFDGMHHHHHHGLQTDGVGQGGGGPIQTAGLLGGLAAGLISTLAGAPGNESGTPGGAPATGFAQAMQAYGTTHANGTQPAVL